MESVILLSLVAALVVTPVTPVSVECLNGNCTESGFIPAFNLGSIFPFFGPVDFDAARDRPSDDAVIDPMGPPTNESDAGGIVSIRIMRVFSIRDPDQDADQAKGELIPLTRSDEFGQPMGDFGQPMGDFGSPFLQKVFDNILADIGLLDLSGRNMTSAEVYSALAARNAEGRPVTTLILSNSRIHPLDAGTFAAAEGTISTLVMANTSVNLDALRGLTNLKVLNLSDNGLSTFAWYGLMAHSLEVLDLSNNKFEEVRPELSMLKNLRELYLSNNKIMYVEEAPLNLLPNLETLDLSMNMLQRANFASLNNLSRLNVDWNYLVLMGSDCRLPPQPLALKLASNPWRCDCGMLHARDANEILDLDLLQCANHQSYSYCDSCPRVFLPSADAPDKQAVSDMTKDSIEHLDCFDLPELYKAISRLRQHEPEKFAFDVCLFVGLIMLFIVVASLTVAKCCRKKATNRKFWLNVQQIPHLEKIGKPKEVPYIKIEEPLVNA